MCHHNYLESLVNITEYIPKPLIEINGKSALQYNIELLHRYGIFKPDIIINNDSSIEELRNTVKNAIESINQK